ncbi:hypothetical protein HK096_004455, partial [Nowakowskiella sp. JEL0078]
DGDNEEESVEESDDDDSDDEDEVVNDSDLEDLVTDEELDEDLRAKIVQILGDVAVPLNGIEKIENEDVDEIIDQSNEDGDDESELSDVGDDEMGAFDEKLAEIFKERKKLKETKKDIKSQTTNFKLRVITLLETYLKRHTSKWPTIVLVRPLTITLLTTPKTDFVRGKLESLVVSKVLKPKDTIKLENNDHIELALSELKKLHQLVRSRKANDQVILAIAVVVKSLMAASKRLEDESINKKIISQYIETLIQTAKSPSLTNIFADLVLRYPAFAPQMTSAIINQMNPSEPKKFNALSQILMSVCKVTGISIEKAAIKTYGEKLVNALEWVENKGVSVVIGKKRKIVDNNEVEGKGRVIEWIRCADIVAKTIERLWDENEVSELWNVDKISRKLKAVASDDGANKDLRRAANVLCGTLGVVNNQITGNGNGDAKKRKTDISKIGESIAKSPAKSPKKKNINVKEVIFSGIAIYFIVAMVVRHVHEVGKLGRIMLSQMDSDYIINATGSFDSKINSEIELVSDEFTDGILSSARHGDLFVNDMMNFFDEEIFSLRVSQKSELADLKLR